MVYIEEIAGEVLSSAVKLAADYSAESNKVKSKQYKPGNSGLNRSSIMRASKDLIMSFPVLCSDTVMPETAMMITKAVERNCVTTLQLLFSSAYLSGNDGREILKQWHNNMDDDLSMDEYLDLVDSMSATYGLYKGNAANNPYDLSDKSISSFAKEAALNESYVIPAVERELSKKFLDSMNYYPVSSFSESSLNELSVRANFDGSMNIVSEAKKRDLNERKFDQQTQQNRMQNAIEFQKLNNAREERMKSEREFDKRQAQQQAQFDKDFEARQAQNDIVNQQNKERNDSQAEFNRLKNNREELSDRMDYFNKMLLDSDVKKCNELVPSLIIVRYNVIDAASNGLNVEREFIAGVKARLIPTPSEDIISHIHSLDKTKVSFVNWVRATTGEISFAKDFVMAIDQAKIDAKNNSKLSKTSPIWRSLQARSTRSGMNRLMKKNRANDAGAITTLVITQEEANILKKEFDFDITLPTKAKFVMENYNLMCMIIVDEQVEVARFLMDGEKYWQNYSFGSLERETGDGSYKKIINLISKVNRG